MVIRSIWRSRSPRSKSCRLTVGNRSSAMSTTATRRRFRPPICTCMRTDAFTYLMARSGTTTARSRRRLVSDAVPSIQDVHFPMGGHRFRPCLEDVLHMLIEEFGIDRQSETFQALEEGRIAWRRKQARSVVRDDPESAVNALRQLGYDVDWRHESGEPPVRWDRLRER